MEGLDVQVDAAPAEGAFLQAPPMDAAPPPASMHQGAEPAPAMQSQKPARRRRAAPTGAQRVERADIEEVTLDPEQLRASARSRSGPGAALATLVVVGLAVATCAGVGMAGSAMWWMSADDAVDDVAEEEIPDDEPDAPTRTGSRGSIPVEKGLRRGGGAPPEPTRPDVPDPEE